VSRRACLETLKAASQARTVPVGFGEPDTLLRWNGFCNLRARGETMKSISLINSLLATALGVLSACSHDRPAKDASSTDDSSTIAPTGNAPTGHSRPTDDALGTDMTPEPHDADSTRGSGSSSSGSGTNSTDSGSSSH